MYRFFIVVFLWLLGSICGVFARCDDFDNVISYIWGSAQLEKVNLTIQKRMSNDGFLDKANVQFEIWPGKYVLVNARYTSDSHSLSSYALRYCNQIIARYTFFYKRNVEPDSLMAWHKSNWFFDSRSISSYRIFANGQPRDFVTYDSSDNKSHKRITDGLSLIWDESGKVDELRVTHNNKESNLSCEKDFDYMLRYLWLSQAMGKDINIPFYSKNKSQVWVTELPLGWNYKSSAKYDQDGLLKSTSTLLCNREVRRQQFTKLGIITEEKRELPGGYITIMKYTERNMPLEYSRYKLINGKEVRDGLYLRWVTDKDILETQSFYVNGEERIPPYLY